MATIREYRGSGWTPRSCTPQHPTAEFPICAVGTPTSTCWKVAAGIQRETMFPFPCRLPRAGSSAHLLIWTAGHRHKKWTSKVNFKELINKILPMSLFFLPPVNCVFPWLLLQLSSPAPGDVSRQPARQPGEVPAGHSSLLPRVGTTTGKRTSL